MIDKSILIDLSLDLSIMRVNQTNALSPEQLRQSQEIGWGIARLRAARRMRQEEAALRAGISRNTAYRLEHGDPGVAIGQLLRYLDAIAPGLKLVDALAMRDPSLQALRARELTGRVRAMTKQELIELDF